MSEPLVFMMGKFPAPIPLDRRYASNHMWCMSDGDVHRFGFTSYAVRLLQDVYFLEWSRDPGDRIVSRQELGSIESSKAESSLYAPLTGLLIEFNESLLDDPSTINVDNHDAGWLFSLQGEPEGLLSPEEYYNYVDEGWEKTQRTLKGQLN